MIAKAVARIREKTARGPRPKKPRRVIDIRDLYAAAKVKESWLQARQDQQWRSENFNIWEA